MPHSTSLDLPGAYLLETRPFKDERGWFARYFCVAEFEPHAPGLRFVQFNHSCTRRRGSLRGMHLQTGASAEEKLVRCIAGAVLDVLVDLRRGSPTFLRHVAVELSAANGRTLFVPKGVAHGFQTLAEDTQLIYHHSNFYDPGAEAGVRFDDPRLGIHWPLPPADVSDKDRAWPLLSPEYRGFVTDDW